MLSIEEKATRYDEIREKAKVLKECSTNTEVVGYMDELFPELKEGWDEMVRKALIAGFKDYNGWDAEWFDGITVREAIDWLEKQGEKAKYHDICDKCVRQPTCQSDCFLQQGEQKPAWSEEDEKILKDIITDVKFEGYNNDMQANSYKKINWLKSLKGRVQPKQEWSEEDKDNLEYVLEIAEEGKPLDDLGICFLESLKDRVQPQSHWKPSDEQMIAINTAINVIGKGTLNGKQLIELQEQLKKLREE